MEETNLPQFIRFDGERRPETDTVNAGPATPAPVVLSARRIRQCLLFRQ